MKRPRPRSPKTQVPSKRGLFTRLLEAAGLGTLKRRSKRKTESPQTPPKDNEDAGPLIVVGPVMSLPSRQPMEQTTVEKEHAIHADDLKPTAADREAGEKSIRQIKAAPETPKAEIGSPKRQHGVPYIQVESAPDPETGKPGSRTPEGDAPNMAIRQGGEAEAKHRGKARKPGVHKPGSLTDKGTSFFPKLGTLFSRHQQPEHDEKAKSKPLITRTLNSFRTLLPPPRSQDLRETELEGVLQSPKGRSPDRKPAEGLERSAQQTQQSSPERSKPIRQEVNLPQGKVASEPVIPDEAAGPLPQISVEQQLSESKVGPFSQFLASIRKCLQRPERESGTRRSELLHNWGDVRESRPRRLAHQSPTQGSKPVQPKHDPFAAINYNEPECELERNDPPRGQSEDLYQMINAHQHEPREDRHWPRPPDTRPGSKSVEPEIRHENHRSRPDAAEIQSKQVIREAASEEAVGPRLKVPDTRIKAEPKVSAEEQLIRPKPMRIIASPAKFELDAL